MKKAILKAFYLAGVFISVVCVPVGSAGAMVVDQGDGTVLETTRGLAWLQDWGPLAPAQWEQQQAKIADLNASNYLGHNDWYMPSTWDFYALWDGVGASNEGLRAVFSNTPYSFYWTSTEDPNITSNHYAFDVYGGGQTGGYYGYNLSSTVVRNVAVPVPEPQTYALMLVGLAVVGAAARRKASRAQ